MEKPLEKFRAAKGKEHRVKFHWLRARVRVLYRKTTASDDSVIKSHVIVCFLHQDNISMLSRQQNKKKNKKDKIPRLQK